jgi:hypothetical protein
MSLMRRVLGVAVVCDVVRGLLSSFTAFTLNSQTSHQTGDLTMHAFELNKHGKIVAQIAMSGLTPKSASIVASATISMQWSGGNRIETADMATRRDEARCEGAPRFAQSKYGDRRLCHACAGPFSMKTLLT